MRLVLRAFRKHFGLHLAKRVREEVVTNARNDNDLNETFQDRIKDEKTTAAVSSILPWARRYTLLPNDRMVSFGLQMKASTATQIEAHGNSNKPVQTQ